MSPRRRRSNPLALAVLACLVERPMHPYEVATTLKGRHKHTSIRLNYGSLYTVVEALARDGLIEAQETGRSGHRPERTVYRVTEPGRRECEDWLRDLLSKPVKEYLQFEAGLSLAGLLPPDEVLALLDERCRALESQVAEWHATIERTVEQGIPRLFLVEAEYQAMLLAAELEWTRELIRRIASGELEGVDWWRATHRELERARAEGRPPDITTSFGPSDDAQEERT